MSNIESRGDNSWSQQSRAGQAQPRAPSNSKARREGGTQGAA